MRETDSTVASYFSEALSVSSVYLSVASRPKSDQGLPVCDVCSAIGTYLRAPSTSPQASVCA